MSNVRAEQIHVFDSDKRTLAVKLFDSCTGNWKEGANPTARHSENGGPMRAVSWPCVEIGGGWYAFQGVDLSPGAVHAVEVMAPGCLPDYCMVELDENGRTAVQRVMAGADTQTSPAARAWIPVTERLPEPGGEYLIYGPNEFDGHSIRCSEYDRIWGWSPTYPIREITHWMMLPEGPR